MTKKSNKQTKLTRESGMFKKEGLSLGGRVRDLRNEKGWTLEEAGLRMNMDPVGFNKDIFGDVEGVDSGEMSASRLAIGGGIMALGLLNLYCSMNLDEGTATQTVLIGTVIGLATFFVTIASAKFRGFTSDIPKLPMIVLPTLIAICLYSAMG